MSIGRTRAVALLGLTGVCIDVEADVAPGLPRFALVGLPDRALGEAAERVRSAVVNSGLPMPTQRVTINLSPAALPKTGSGFDLAIAIAALSASARTTSSSVAECVHIGELALDGRVRPTPGVLPAVMGAAKAGVKTVLVPAGNLAEARLVPEIRVVGVASLSEALVWHGLLTEAPTVNPISVSADTADELSVPDLAEVVGQSDAVDALTYVAAGGHHMSMVGPPGAGKTMLASRLPGILPDLSTEAALEVACIRSLLAETKVSSLSLRPPFESPHHSASVSALVGGGTSILRPGAIARASHGVLFLDEAPEFNANVLEALRQPLESGEIHLQRATMSAVFPARFMLVMASNPCPCGKNDMLEGACTCTPLMIRRYAARLSGPLRDRVDVHLRVRAVTPVQLRITDQPVVTSEHVRARVKEARAVAAERWRALGAKTNASVSGTVLRSRAWRLPTAVSSDIDRALQRGGLSMRGYDRTLRLAWTISDVEGTTSPTRDQIGRALSLRKDSLE